MDKETEKWFYDYVSRTIQRFKEEMIITHWNYGMPLESVDVELRFKK